MKTKFTVSMVVTVEHIEKVRVLTREIQKTMKTRLQGKTLDQHITASITKVTIRSIDFD